MQDYCTSSALSRRQFLKGLLAWGGLWVGLPKEAAARPIPELACTHRQQPGSGVWTEPVWMVSLADNRYLFPANQAVPHGLPGSLMKLVAATALLEEKLLSPNQALECRGSITLNGQTFHCQHAHGKLTIQEAIGLSCNVFFAQAANTLSIRRFLQYAQLYGLNTPAAQNASFIFPAEFANGHPSQAYALGLNRNLQPNALQLARMAALIARREIRGLHDNTWQVLQQGMRLAASRGTASELQAAARLRIAAKTGTTVHGNTFQSWLVGYFPFDNPRYAFCARAAAGTAKEAAVPLAQRFLLARQWDIQ